MNSNHQPKHKIKCPGKLLNNCSKTPISRLRDPSRGPCLLCCPINIDNNNTYECCVRVGLWVGLFGLGCGLKWFRIRRGMPYHTRTAILLSTAINICFEQLLFLCSFRLWGVFGLKKASNWAASLTKKDCGKCKPSSNIDCTGAVHIVRVVWRFR